MSQNRRAIILVFFAIFIDCLGVGLIIPVIPDLMVELTENSSMSNASKIGGFIVATYAIMQFACGPIFGGLSDQYGRRPVLLASLFGFGLDYITTALAPTVWWLFLARFVAGILGASYTSGAAYIADISTPETRAKNFGVIGMAFGLGFTFGPLLGAALGTIGLRVPFFVAAGLSFLNFLLSYFFLPESLKPENRRKFEWKRANPFGTFKTLFKNTLIRQLFLSLLLIYLAAQAVQGNWTYFVTEKFGWGKLEIGISITVVGVSFSLVQGFLIRIINPKLGPARSVYVGLGLYGLGFVLYAMASQGWMLYVFTAVYCMGSIAGPSLQSIMANLVPPNAQGELQGGFAGLQSICAFAGPLLMSSLIFSYFTGESTPFYFPGAPMVLAAVFAVIAVFIARAALKKHPIPNTPPPNTETAVVAH